MPASYVGYPSGFTQPECRGKPHWNGWKDTLLCFEPSLLTAEEAAVWPTFVNQTTSCLVAGWVPSWVPLCSQAPTTEESFQYCLHTAGYLQLFQDISVEPRCLQWSSWTKWSCISIQWKPLRNSQELSSFIFRILSGRSSTLVCGSQDTSAWRALRACWGEYPHHPWMAEAPLPAGDLQGRLSSCFFQADGKL